MYRHNIGSNCDNRYAIRNWFMKTKTPYRFIPPEAYSSDFNWHIEVNDEYTIVLAKLTGCPFGLSKNGTLGCHRYTFLTNVI
jgi:hypothetical protein